MKIDFFEINNLIFFFYNENIGPRLLILTDLMVGYYRIKTNQISISVEYKKMNFLKNISSKIKQQY